MKKTILSLLFSISAQASLNDVDRAELAIKNILRNPGFENGRANWTASGGTLSTVTSGSNLLIGRGSVTWDSSGAGQTLTSAAVTIPNGLRGRSGAAFCSILTPSGTATHTIQAFDGTNILATTSIVSNTSPANAGVSFIFPSSGSISLRLVSVASDEPLIAIDDCYLGAAEGTVLSNVSQANFIGEARIVGTTNCAPTNSSASLAAYGADTDCPGPTIVSNPGPGVIQTTDADNAVFTVNNLPPGRYKIVIKGGMIAAAGAAVTTSNAISDGTTTTGQVSYRTGTSGEREVDVVGWFNYSNSGNRTFTLFGATASGTQTLNIQSAVIQDLTFSIERYPLSNEQVSRVDQLANSWSGYHDATCSWARTNTSYGNPTADASCALVERTNQNFGTVSTSGSVLPAITFTPKRAGRYYACATLAALGSNSGASAGFRFWDGTTTIGEYEAQVASTTRAVNASLCGIYVASSTSAVTLSIQTKSDLGTMTIQTIGAASSIEWSIFQIDQSFPSPATTQDVTSSSSGRVRLASAFISNSGTPTIARQDGNWISSLVDNGVGDTTINISAGTFSTVPNCICTLQVAAAEIGHCNVDTTTAPSTTVLRLQTTSTVPADIDRDFHIMCIGAP